MFYEQYERYLPSVDPLVQQLNQFAAIEQKVEKLSNFANHIGVLPQILIEPILNDMRQLRDDCAESSATTPESLLLKEIYRKMDVNIMQMEQRREGKSPTFHDMMKMYGINASDFHTLEPWLIENKPHVEELIQRLFTEGNYKDISDIPFDITRQRRQAEEFAAKTIADYNPHLHELAQHMWGDYDPSYTVELTTKNRSYYSPSLNYAALSIAALCELVQPNNVNQLNEHELTINLERLLELWGHEVVGHGAIQQHTNNAQLPSVLASTSTATIATQESIAQHYEREFLIRLGEYPHLLSQLNIEERYADLVQHYQSWASIDAYNRKASHFIRYTLADPEKHYGNDPQNRDTIDAKKNAIKRISLDPRSADRTVEGTRTSFRSDGGLNTDIVSELRYFPNPVSRVLQLGEMYEIPYTNYVNQRLIDRHLLQGFWTPQGLIEYANLTFSQISGKPLIDLESNNLIAVKAP